MSRSLQRRDFLKQSAWLTGGLAAGVYAAPSVAQESKSPNEKLNIACVGVANKGRHNIDQLTSENITVLCDVDENFLDQAAKVWPHARLYRDYRKMLEAEANKIDAVVVSTSDHTHAPATSVALDLGKHVYCEKPLTHTVAEARAISMLAKKKGVATQMGTQIHAGENYRRVVELIQSNAIGKVTEVYSWCTKGWSDGRFNQCGGEAPKNLNWDLWLGPAKERSYCGSIHPGNWRRFWEYGAGTFGDMACHVMDLPFWALDLKYPTSVACEGPEVHPDGAPNWCKATYTFPMACGCGDIKFHWADGSANFDKVKETKDPSGKPLSSWGLGVLFVGNKGMLAADYGRRLLLPQDKFEGFKAPDQTIANSIGHWNEWVKACKTGSPTTCNFDYSGRLTETVLLGIVAFRSGEKVEWDGEKLEAKGSAKAASFVTKEYRKGFEVVGLKG